MTFWELIYKACWVILAVIGVVFIVLIFSPQLRKERMLQNRKAELRELNQRTQARLNDLVEKQNRFTTDPEYIKRIARENGMVETNETVVKFTNREARAGEEVR